MVRSKRITRSSKKAYKENEASENALGQSKTSDPVQVDVEPPKAAVQGEDKIEISLDLDLAESGKDGETPNLEIKNAITVDKDENEMLTEISGDDSAEEDLNSSEDDEIYSEESMWDDDDENLEEINEEDTVDKDENNVELQTGEDELIEDHAETEDEVKKKENAEEEKEKEKEITNGDGGTTQEPVTEKVKAGLKEEVDKSTGRGRKKVQPASSKKLKPTDEHKPESSRKRKAKERVEGMGMIFMCSSTTKEDCFRYRVFGLPASKKDTVEKIYPGMRLFLYDVDLKLLNGIYKSAGPGGYNIEPKAFKSQFPSQVRFRVLKDCLPIAEEKFKKVIKDNYFSKNKFDCKLTSLQVNKLCKLFLAKSKGHRLAKSGRILKAESHTTVRRGRLGLRRAEEDRLHSVREERKYHNRSHKRQRRIPVSPVREPLPLRVPSPLPSSVRLYAHDRTLEEDPYRKYPYLEIREPYWDGPILSHGDPYRDRRDPPIEHGSYRDGRDPPTERRDSYRDGRYPPTERRDSYRDGRDPPPERRDSYRDGRDPPIERRDSYRDGREHHDFYGVRRDPPTERHDPYRDVQDIQLGRPSPYRDGQRAYIDHHDPYNDRRDPHMLRRSPPRAIPQSDPYITYRRDPLSDHRDVYRVDHLVETRESYGRKLLLDHRDLPPHLESRRLDDISSRDYHVSHKARPAYMEPTYSAEYPSRAGLESNLRPIGPSNDHSARGQLSGYYSRRA